jgi:hypothetical protein
MGRWKRNLGLSSRRNLNSRFWFAATVQMRPESKFTVASHLPVSVAAIVLYSYCTVHYLSFIKLLSILSFMIIVLFCSCVILLCRRVLISSEAETVSRFLDLAPRPFEGGATRFFFFPAKVRKPKLEPCGTRKDAGDAAGLDQS